MRTKRVAIYGGTNLNSPTSKFVGQLTTALLACTDAVLVTGGYDYSADFPNFRSTDRSVADAADEYATKVGIPLASRLETWLPQPTKDRIAEKVQRFKKGEVVWLEGGARKRRLRIVNDVNTLVTIKGETHTALVLDMALAIGKPALPLPFTGGDSTEFWNEYKAYYQTRFSLSDRQIVDWEAMRLENPGEERTERARRICDEAVEAISRVLRTSCLVLMPFRPELDTAYNRLKDAIGLEGFEPIRLDEKLYTGDIRATVMRLVEETDAIIADVTEASPNVLYEVGYAHARDRNPLLIWRVKDGAVPALPFYLKPQRLVFVSNDGDVRNAVAQYLEEVRRGKP